MARRSEKRDAAKAEYCARRAKGEQIVLKDFAAKLGVSKAWPKILKEVF